MDRRTVLKGITATVPLLAGCSGFPGMEFGGSNGKNGGKGTDSSPTKTTAEKATKTVKKTTKQKAKQTITSVGTEGGFPISTATPGTGSGSVGTLDPSTFTTYTNSTYSYSILYPGDWQVNDTDPAVVEIEPTSGIPSMRIDVNENQGQVSLDTMSTMLDEYLKEMFAEYQTLNKRKIRLQTGQECLIVEAKIRMNSEGMSVTLYDKYSMTIAAGRMYMVQTFATESGYPSVKAGLDTILESLRINV